VKSSELKKLIGLEIEWLDNYCPKRGNYAIKRATLLDVQGKNVMIDTGGGYDWKWLPDMCQIKAVASGKVQPGEL